jgi:hypothetical protein
MFDQFKAFVESRLVRVTGGSCQLRMAYYRFLDDLTPKERQVWPRWRFLAELKGMGIAVAKRGRVDELVGWSLLPPAGASVPATLSKVTVPA